MVPDILAVLGLFAIVLSSVRAEMIDPRLKAAFAAAKTERVAVIALGDSNQRFGGHGWSHYMGRALGEAFGCYGTDFTVYRQFQEKDAPPPPAAPTELADKAFSYWYIEPGRSAPVSWKNRNFIIPADHPIGISGRLRFHFRYGTFAETQVPGHFQPIVRRDQPPWTILDPVTTPINPATGTYAMERLTLDLPADSSRSWPVQFRPVPANQEISGPFFASLAYAENPDRKTGLAYHTLYAVGGKSLGEMVEFLRSLKPAQADEFFGEIIRGLDSSGQRNRRGIVMISSGLNDRNRNTPSLGDSPAPCSTPEGYADNLRALVSEIAALWTRNGGAPDSLYFAILVSHTLGDPEDKKIASYREAVSTLATTRTDLSLIDLSKLVPYAEMKSRGYYDRKESASDAHLSREGYKAISTALADELIR